METYELEDLINLKQECLKSSEIVAFHSLKYRYATRRDCNQEVIDMIRMDLESAIDRYEQDQISLEAACERYSAKTDVEEEEECSKLGKFKRIINAAIAFDDSTRCNTCKIRKQCDSATEDGIIENRVGSCKIAFIAAVFAGLIDLEGNPIKDDER